MCEKGFGIDPISIHADATGSSWQPMPKKHKANKKDVHTSKHKINKTCLSILLCANSDSSYKLISVTIGKVIKIRVLKNCNDLPVIYIAHKSAWLNRKKIVL